MNSAQTEQKSYDSRDPDSYIIEVGPSKPGVAFG
jgi:hypothetical protein